MSKRRGALTEKAVKGPPNGQNRSLRERRELFLRNLVNMISLQYNSTKSLSETNQLGSILFYARYNCYEKRVTKVRE